MDNSKYRSHPHICPHLWHLWHIEKLTGGEIIDLTVEMQLWLDNNCIENGERTFFWDDHYTKLPFAYNKDYKGGIGIYNLHEVSLANFLAFKHREDLLAFRLRWGIQDNSDAKYDRIYD